MIRSLLTIEKPFTTGEGVFVVSGKKASLGKFKPQNL